MIALCIINIIGFVILVSKLDDLIHNLYCIHNTNDKSLNEIENNLSDILERLGGKVTIEEQMSRAGY